MEYISALEQSLGLTAKKVLLPIQPGDVPATAADTSALEAWVDFRPTHLYTMVLQSLWSGTASFTGYE